MRIGIDVRYLSHGLVGGVHTYIRQLVPALVQAASGHELLLYADQKAPFELVQLPGHVTVRYLPWRHGASSVLNDMLLLRRAMAADMVEVAHFPANYGYGPRTARTVLTMHDAMTLMPLSHVFQSKGTNWNTRTRAMTVYLYLCSHLALRGAALVLTVSEHARSEIARYSRYPVERIVPVYHAPTPDLRRIEDAHVLAEVRVRHGLGRRPFILADGLKNPAVLLRAWRRIPPALRGDHTIVFFSRREPLPVVRQAAEAGECLLLLNLPRAELVALFSAASAFVFPSWLEGFGIPILEAMLCGAPVIASDRGSIPEVAGGAALICDAEDDGALAELIVRVLSDPAEAGRLRQLGFARAAQFSWRKAADQTLAAYRRALGWPLAQLLAEGYPAERS